MHEKLPVFAILGEAGRCLLRHWRLLLPYGVALLIIWGAITVMAMMFGMTVFVSVFAMPSAVGKLPSAVMLMMGMAGLAFTLAGLPVMTSCQRLAVQGDGARVGFAYGREEWLMIGAFFRSCPLFLAVGLSAGLGSGAAAFLAVKTHFIWAAVPVLLVVWCYCLLFVLRLSLVFPAAALGEKLPVRAALHLGKGNAWRLFGIFVLPSLAVQVLSAVRLFLTTPRMMPHSPGIMMPPVWGLPLWGHLVFLFLGMAINLLCMALVWMGIALAYRRLLPAPPREMEGDGSALLPDGSPTI